MMETQPAGIAVLGHKWEQLGALAGLWLFSIPARGSLQGCSQTRPGEMQCYPALQAYN